MENSPLRKLPPELRNRIYELVLQQDCPVFIFDKHAYKRYSRQVNTKRGPVAGASMDSESLSLTQTCKDLRAECKTMFFHLNEFCIQHQYRNWPKTEKLLRNFLDNIGIENAEAVRSISVDSGVFCPIDVNHAVDEVGIALESLIFSWKIPEITLKLQYETIFLFQSDGRLTHHMELQACNMEASLLSEIERVKSKIKSGCKAGEKDFMEQVQRELETMLARLPKDQARSCYAATTSTDGVEGRI